MSAKISQLAAQVADLQRQLGEAQQMVETTEVEFREICLVFGFDLSDGEGTSPAEVTKHVKYYFSELTKECDGLKINLAACEATKAGYLNELIKATPPASLAKLKAQWCRELAELLLKISKESLRKDGECFTGITLANYLKEKSDALEAEAQKAGGK